MDVDGDSGLNYKDKLAVLKGKESEYMYEDKVTSSLAYSSFHTQIFHVCEKLQF